MNNQNSENRMISIETGKKLLSAWWLALAALVSLLMVAKLVYGIKEETIIIKALLGTMIYVCAVYSLCNLSARDDTEERTAQLVLLLSAIILPLIFLSFPWPELAIVLFFLAGATFKIFLTDPSSLISVGLAMGIVFCFAPPLNRLTEAKQIELMAGGLALILGLVWMILVPRLAEVIRQYRQAWVALIRFLTHR